MILVRLLQPHNSSCIRPVQSELLLPSFLPAPWLAFGALRTAPGAFPHQHPGPHGTDSPSRRVSPRMGLRSPRTLPPLRQLARPPQRPRASQAAHVRPSVPRPLRAERPACTWAGPATSSPIPAPCSLLPSRLISSRPVSSALACPRPRSSALRHPLIPRPSINPSTHQSAADLRGRARSRRLAV